MQHEIGSTRAESVLVVDDDPQCRRLTVRLLAELGYRRIYEASSVFEALAILSRRHPDLVLVDVVMQKRNDGLIVAWQARSESIPVGLVTGVPLDFEPEARSFPLVSKDALTVESLRALVATLLASGRAG